MNKVNESFVIAGEVNLLEHKKPPSLSSRIEKRNRNRNLIRIFFVTVVLLAFIIGAILLALIRKSNIDFQRQQVKEAAQIFCSTTEHFPACLSSISSPITTTSRHKWTGPDEIFVLSLQLAIEQLSNLTSLTKSLISNSTDQQSRSDTAALQQCTSLIHDSLDRLNRCLTTSAAVSLFYWPADGDPEQEIQLQTGSLAREKIHFMVPKVNDTVNDLRTCFQLLLRTESAAVDEVIGRVNNAMVDAAITFDFLQNRDDIIYRLRFLNFNSGYHVNFGHLSNLLIFFPQYLILVLLFWLIYRIY